MKKKVTVGFVIIVITQTNREVQQAHSISKLSYKKP